MLDKIRGSSTCIQYRYSHKVGYAQESKIEEVACEEFYSLTKKNYDSTKDAGLRAAESPFFKDSFVKDDYFTVDE